MFLRERSKEGLDENREGFEFVAADGKAEEGEVDRSSAEAFEEDGSDLLDDGNFYFRKFSGKFSEVWWKEIRRDRRNDSNGDGAAHGVFLLCEIAASGFEFTQDSAGTRKKGLADFGETHGAAEAIEETCAEFIFEFADLLRE